MRKVELAVLCLSVTTAVSVAQQPSVVDQLVDNYSKLSSKVELNRQVYFPSEEIAVTVTVRNPTTGPLLVATPFHIRTGAFGVLEQQEDGTWRETSPSESSELLMNATTPNVVMNPGEERQLSARSTDPEFDGSTTPHVPGHAPTQPGTYQYFYDMGGGRQNFRVVNPFFETAAETKVRADLIVTEDGQTYVMPQYLHVFSVQWDQVSYICVSRLSIIDGLLYPRRGQRLTYNQMAPATPFKRVLTTATPIQELRVAEDPLGNFVVNWRIPTTGRASFG